VQTECNTERLVFSPWRRGKFAECLTVNQDSGAITSDAGALLLLREVEAKLGIIARFPTTIDPLSFLKNLFIEAQQAPPKQIILDFDATSSTSQRSDPRRSAGPLLSGLLPRVLLGCRCTCFAASTCFVRSFVRPIKTARPAALRSSPALLPGEPVERIRRAWPDVQIIVRADVGV